MYRMNLANENNEYSTQSKTRLKVQCEVPALDMMTDKSML